ncbi:MAG: hypothetical protein ACR2LK_10060 [Solirubrobacteraceae bacterium]
MVSGRILGGVVIIAALVAIALLVVPSGGGYAVQARFVSASQIVEGNQVNPGEQSQILPSFDCDNSGEKGPTNRPGCEVAGPIGFGGLTQRFPNVREAGPGGVLP